MQGRVKDGKGRRGNRDERKEREMEEHRGGKWLCSYKQNSLRKAMLPKAKVLDFLSGSNSIIRLLSTVALPWSLCAGM